MEDSRSTRTRADSGPTTPEQAGEEGIRRDYRPTGADEKPSTFATLKRTLTEFNEDQLTDAAAALTYYGLLALFPALIALVSIVGLVADPQETTDALTTLVTQIGPESAAQTFSGPIESITSSNSASGILFIVGLATALWSASGYVGAFMRASNVIYETPEGRPIWKLRPLQMLVTLIIVLLVALLAVALVATGPLADAIGQALGLSDTFVTVWDIAKWPVMLAIVITIIAVLYYATPNVKLRGFKWVTPGSAIAVLVWILASAAFAFYVANFGSYDKTYGSLGGVVIFLMWLWITNLALLFGHELNAERERSHELAAGVPRAERELQLEPRDEPKEQRTT
jgi:membrane protein